ncbi:MAG: ArnT family glycosyltransferase [Desulfobacca sp.]|uniref:ArnT family glycosyltransferase n=1 Tax=Desulfobacca sp. TaxID=2067990 RepID=UPI0040491B5D
MAVRNSIMLAIVALTLLWGVIFLPTLGKLPLIRAEAMYAQIPLEMLASGDWLTPRLNGARYLDKPPLYYWLNLAALSLGGQSENAVRLATCLIGLGEVLAAVTLGTLLFSHRSGWLAGLILLTSIGFFALHLQMLADHLITLSLSWSLVFLWLWWQQSRPWQVVGFFACLWVGLMSKGLIGLFFPLGVGGLFAFLTGASKWRRFFGNPWIWLGLAAAAAPWFVLMELRHPGFLYFQVWNEQISRFLGHRYPPDIKPLSLWIFWLFVLVWLMPWTPFLPAGIAALWPRRRWPVAQTEAAGLLLLLWAGATLLFFSLSSSRIEYYSLPTLPALALIVARRLDLYLDAPDSRSMLLSLGLYAIFLLGLLALVPFLEQTCTDNRREFNGMFQQLQPLVHQAGPLLAVLSGALILSCWRRRPVLSLCSLGGISLTLLYFTFLSLWLLSPHLSDAQAGRIIRAAAGPDDLIVMGNIEEFEYGMSLRYYVGRPILMVQRDGLPAFGFPLSAEENYLITPEDLKKLWQGPRRVFLLMDECAPEGYLSTGLTVFHRDGKILVANRPSLATAPLPIPIETLSLKNKP